MNVADQLIPAVVMTEAATFTAYTLARIAWIVRRWLLRRRAHPEEIWDAWEWRQKEMLRQDCSYLRCRWVDSWGWHLEVREGVLLADFEEPTMPLTEANQIRESQRAESARIRATLDQDLDDLPSEDD